MAVSVAIAVDGVALLGFVVVVDNGVSVGVMASRVEGVVILSLVMVDVRDGVARDVMGKVHRVLSLVGVVVSVVEGVTAVEGVSIVNTVGGDVVVVDVVAVVGDTVDSTVNKIFDHLIFFIIIRLD